MADRLTRTELAWLLAQEARSAARTLRQGVTIDVKHEDEAPQSATHALDEGLGLVGTLDRLDEAVSMLANLHGNPLAKGRRGKIDLAALLWEVVPNARVQIEMGEGTMVLGDEAELRRMLHVLAGQSGHAAGSHASPDISIRRERDEIRVSVTLGPDLSAGFESERAWLSRMAMRYGGRLELHGSTQTLFLLADVDHERREVESLQKELARAQAKGEAYARELASREEHRSSVDLRGDLRRDSLAGAEGALDLFGGMCRVLANDMRSVLSAIGRDLAPLREQPNEAGEIATSVARHIAAGSEFVTDLARLGSALHDENLRTIDLSDLLRDVAHEELGRAARRDVRTTLKLPAETFEINEKGTIASLVRVLIGHTIAASMPGTEAALSLSDENGAVVIAFDASSAPRVPLRERTRLTGEWLLHSNLLSFGTIAALTLAETLSVVIEAEPLAEGGTRLRLVIPREKRVAMSDCFRIR